ncbi:MULTISPECIES: site-2 protease family protein [Streptomycetaceae]|uniref:Site-2 protease family protein n=1 Tax=Streptantibioticus cattleyicolor (strain ATCC 35852 / DSM 46488 / JCM 4925 / NBRC 14057 / NRRL 8057) TaxID=1003195 RepID=F8K229_STREN|nr:MULTISPECIES: site-2 protease family protein [Streptomycetaceae]AEW93723.1 hypothetical protein SCATT_13520 [Streptantibioticus cattleyicolor NRRL 8057 = DSM 46488]MYS58415.1 site-2 protease family protein [Streptomyces sp. SID5468]CCB74072.1 Membrane protein [Streptantibioticus cattleyicolor NRRL 8057 = DSM 46488]
MPSWSAARSAGDGRRVSPVFWGILAVLAVSGWGVWSAPAAQGGGRGVRFALFVFVVSGWLVSLCLHEYAHARTALHGGDTSVTAKGYLTLNPLRYTHAALSFVLPVLFVILGGIGLPGGAVYIERGRIRGRWRHSLVSAAGPLVNAVLAVVLALPFWLGATSWAPPQFLAALAFLALLQVTAAILNLLPVPGLDGYGVVEPWLSPGVRRQIEPFAPFGMIAVFGCLWWVPRISHWFWQLVDAVLRACHVPPGYWSAGYELFRFWQR